MSKQPRALELADMIVRYNAGVMSQAVCEDYSDAAAELRRLHTALSASEASDAESLRMYRSARDERNRLAAINAQMLEALQQAVALADRNAYSDDHGNAIRTPECAATYAQCVAAIAAATKEQP
jgi:hypothetical protein